MNVAVVFTFITSLAGSVLLVTISTLLFELYRRSNENSEAQRHCKEEAGRLLQGGASDEIIEEWIVAAQNPVAAEKKRNDRLPGYGLAF